MAKRDYSKFQVKDRNYRESNVSSNPFKTHIAPFALGAAQEIGDILSSVANAPRDLTYLLSGKEGPQFPHPEFERFLPEDASRGAYGLGKLSTWAIPGSQAIKGPKLAKEGLSLARRAMNVPLKGAAYGALTNEYGPGGRIGGAAGGALAGSASRAIPFLWGARNSKLGTKILKDFEGEKSKYTKLYDDLFSEAESKGHKGLPLKFDESKAKNLKKVSDDNLLDRFIKYNENPTLRNAHDLQKDARILISELSKAKKKSAGISSKERAALNEAKKIRADVKEAMGSEFENLGMGGQYEDITSGYRKDVAPYRNNRAIQRASRYPTEEGFIEPNRIPGKLLGESGDPFMRALGSKYPELKFRKFLEQKPVANTLKYSGLGLASWAGLEALANPLRKIFS